MPEQITLYNDPGRISPFCLRVELALQQAGASYTTHGFNVFSRPEWYTKVNPFTGKIPSITYGGPDVSPEEPSPDSYKLTESTVILEFLADVFPDAHLLPPASDPVGRSRVRFFIDSVVRNLEASMTEFMREGADASDKVIGALLKIQALLPDPDAADSGEYAIGKEYTNADSVIAPLLACIDIITGNELGPSERGSGKKVVAAIAGEQFERLRRYKKALWERESLKKIVDVDRIEVGFKKVFSPK